MVLQVLQWHRELPGMEARRPQQHEQALNQLLQSSRYSVAPHRQASHEPMGRLSPCNDFQLA